MRNLVALLVIILVASGCVSEPVPEPRTETSTDAAETVSGATEPPATDAPIVSALAAPPRLQAGDWWDVRVQSPYFVADVTTRLVVAQDGEQEYLLGVADGRGFDEVLEIHIPPLGPVKKDSLGFESHETMFEMLRFPLTQGWTWQTEWWGTPVTLRVETADEGSASLKVSNEWDADYARLTYSADAGFVTRFEIPGYASYEVTDFGRGFKGSVLTAEAYDVVFEAGRWRGVFWGPMPEAPSVSVSVPPGFDRLSVGFVAESASPGLYQVRLKPPRGEEHVFQVLPSEGAGRRTGFLARADPVGSWQSTFVAAGDGSVVAEGIASRTKTMDV